MNLKRSHRQSARRLEPLDRLMDSYVNWRDHSRAVNESYRRWTDSTAGDRGVAYDQYLTALDREEHAAQGYRYTLEHFQSRHTPLDDLSRCRPAATPSQPLQSQRAAVSGVSRS